MSFAWPGVLLLLPVVVFLPFLRRRQFFALPTLRPMTNLFSRRRQWSFLSPLTLSLSGLFLTIALARPQLPNLASTVETPGLDIVVAIDTSGSMGVSDYQMGGEPVTRMAASKAILKRFIAKRNQDRIGLTVFGEEAFAHAPLSMDHQGMAAFIDAISIGLAGDGATAIGEGVGIAAQQLIELQAKEKILILLTDGENNFGIDPLIVARACAEFDIRIYAIRLSGASSQFIEDIDLGVLKTIAETTGGQAFRAQNASTLQQIYSEIDQMEPTPAKTMSWNLADEQYGMWLTIGLLFLLLHLLLSETWLRRLT